MTIEAVMTNAEAAMGAYLLASAFRRGRRNVHASRVRSPEGFVTRASSFIRHSSFVICHFH